MALETMTREQIDAIPDPILRAQVEALLAEKTALVNKVKERSPSWIQLGIYGKGVMGMQLSKNGQIQFTGTRKAWGGFYLFCPELVAILAAAGAPADNPVSNWITQHQAEFSVKPVKAAKGSTTDASTTTNSTDAGSGSEEGASEDNAPENEAGGTSLETDQEAGNEGGTEPNTATAETQAVAA